MRRFDKFSGHRYAMHLARGVMNWHADDRNGRMYRCTCLRSFRLGDGRFGPHAGTVRGVKKTTKKFWFWYPSFKLDRARERR